VCFIRQFTCCSRRGAMKFERWKRVFRGQDISMTNLFHDYPKKHVQEEDEDEDY